MSDFERLKLIGVDKINEDTKVSKRNINFILDGEYKTSQRVHIVHFQGFIKIMEDVYNMDLNTIVSEYESLYEQEHVQYSSQGLVDDDKAIGESDEKKFKSIYIILIFVVILTIIYIFVFRDSKIEQNSSISKNSDTISEDIDSPKTDDDDTKENSPVVKKDSDLETIKGDIKAKESNLSTEVSKKYFNILASKPYPKSISITPFTDEEIWIGIIDLKDKTKTSINIKKEYQVSITDSSVLLIKIGSSNINLKYYTSDINIKRPGKVMYLLYKDHILKRIKFSEFKRLNGGYKW